MYGGGYGTYGGYGGYGGGYGSYGSSYGLSRGNFGLNRSNSLNLNQTNNQNPNQPPQQQINQRKQVFQQYFKMMGGLRSMVQLGFAMVALGNFGSKSWKMLKRIVAFLATSSKKLLYKIAGMHFLTNKMGEAFQKAMMISPNSKNAYSHVNKILFGLRIAAVIVLAVAIKLKKNITKDFENQHDQILKKYQEIKLKQEKIQERQLYEEEFYQKQGYF